LNMVNEADEFKTLGMVEEEKKQEIMRKKE
jgi:hypothetical protein